MKRLIEENKNTSQEYDKIYFERQKKGVDSQDLRRWNKLLRYFKGGDLVDLGCLDSQIYPLLRKKFPEPSFSYTGIDISKEAISDMQKKYLEVGWYAKDIYNLNIVEDCFDYAIMGEVIEHLEEPEKAIKEAMRILKPGGILAISTPLNEARELGAVDLDHHLWSFDKEDLKKLLSPYGRVKFDRLGSEYLPKYKYHFPSLLAWVKKWSIK